MLIAVFCADCARALNYPDDSRHSPWDGFCAFLLSPVTGIILTDLPHKTARIWIRKFSALPVDWANVESRRIGAMTDLIIAEAFIMGIF